MRLIALLFVFALIGVNCQYDPYRTYYRAERTRTYREQPSYELSSSYEYNRRSSSSSYDNSAYGSSSASSYDPEIVIQPTEVVEITWGKDEQIYALCSTAAPDQFEISWIRRLSDQSVKQLSSTHELYIRDIRAEDVEGEIYCRLRRPSDGAIFEKQLIVSTRNDYATRSDERYYQSEEEQARLRYEQDEMRRQNELRQATADEEERRRQEYERQAYERQERERSSSRNYASEQDEIRRQNELRQAYERQEYERSSTIDYVNDQSRQAYELTIEPLSDEDLNSGYVSRRCHFGAYHDQIGHQYSFRWLDQDGRVISNSDSLRTRLNDPREISQYRCEATERSTNRVYYASYRVTRQAVDVATDSRTSMEYEVYIRGSSSEIVIGQPYTMTCEVRPSPREPVTFEWYYKGQLVSRGPQQSIGALTFDQLGQYVCSARWRSSDARIGSLASNASLQLNLAFTQSTEIDLTAPPGSTMVTMEGVFKELHCEYDASRPRQVEWYFNGNRLYDDRELNLTGRIWRMDRQLVSIIAINGTEMRHMGEYKCIVDGVVKIAHLIVRIDVELMVNPPKQTVNVGESAEVHCRIERSKAINRELQWFFRTFGSEYVQPLEVNVPGAFRRDDNTVTTLTSFISTNSARKSDEGEYICRHPPTGTEASGLIYVVERVQREHRIYITPSIVRVRVSQAISVECYITDDAGQPVSFVPQFRVRDDRVRFTTSSVDRNRARFDLVQGLTRDYNGTEIECFSPESGISVTSIIIIEDMCPADYRRCRSGQCLMSGRFCDGVRDCDDGSDEDAKYCDICDPIAKRCLDYQGRQPLKSTYMIHWTCDGEDDCGNGYDESACADYSSTKCSEMVFRCPNDNREIPWSFVCDKESDCSNGEDERNCGPPVIQTPEQSTYRVRQGTTVTLTCRVTGNPIPYVIWRFNWHCLPDEHRFRVNNIAEQCSSTMPTVVSTLTITNVQPGDDGIYNCEGLSGLNRALSADYRLMLEYV